MQIDFLKAKILVVDDEQEVGALGHGAATLAHKRRRPKVE